MPRSGSNPMKQMDRVHTPQDITIALLTYVPILEGYWKEALDVLEVCVNSILSNTSRHAFDLLIFDNGSCLEAQDYLINLKSSGTVQFLMLSEQNIGKVGAWNMIFGSAPGKLIVYADSDMLFLPNWLDETLRVFETYPKVGMVTARPTRQDYALERGYLSNTLTAVQATANLNVDKGNLLPNLYQKAHSFGMGDTPFQAQQRRLGYDVVISYQGVRAYVGASHQQFAIKRDVVKSFLPFEVETPLSNQDDVKLEVAVDRAKWWLLSTDSYLVHHLGNTLSSQLPSELEWLDVAPYKGRTSHTTNQYMLNSPRALQRILASSHFGRVARMMHKVSVNWLYIHQTLRQ